MRVGDQTFNNQNLFPVSCIVSTNYDLLCLYCVFAISNHNHKDLISCFSYQDSFPKILDSYTSFYNSANHTIGWYSGPSIIRPPVFKDHLAYKTTFQRIDWFYINLYSHLSFPAKDRPVWSN